MHPPVCIDTSTHSGWGGQSPHPPVLFKEGFDSKHPVFKERLELLPTAFRAQTF